MTNWRRILLNVNSKTYTYIGFAVRAGKIVYGINQAETCRKSQLLLLCRTASENARKQAVDLAKKKNIDLIMTVSDDLENIVNKTNCKTVVITDKNLARAVIENMGSDYTSLSRRER